ncbi:Sphingomyelin phosphodiesterase, partial [Mortierella sp. AD011]
MRFSTIILSLAAASAVYSAPVQNMSKRNWFTDDLKSLITKALSTLECDACEAALVGVKDVALLNKQWVLDAVNDLCPTLSKEPAAVCAGLVNSQGPVLINSLLSADLTGGDAKEICFQIGGICPAPAISSGTLTFPKARPANPVVPTPSGVQVDVLHLSDWHVDEHYVAGSEAACSYPTCCRRYSDSSTTVNRSASSWGDYNCDSPVKLGQNLLSYVPTVAKPSFAILTGDIPPHDVWLESQSTVVPEESDAYTNMAGLGINIYPTVGNHEAGPPNLFPTAASGGDLSWLYSSLASDWSRWLPSDAVTSVKNYGAYT